MATAAKKKPAKPKAKPVRKPRAGSFTQAMADAICKRIAEGESLRSICKDSKMPASSSVFKWLAADAVFADQYTRAREAQADTMADDILQIADDGANDTYVDDEGNKRVDQDVIARSRLRVDARKWLASKMAPKKYGDRQTVDLNAKVEMTESAIDDRLAQLLKTVK